MQGRTLSSSTGPLTPHMHQFMPQDLSWVPATEGGKCKPHWGLQFAQCQWVGALEHYANSKAAGMFSSCEDCLEYMRPLKPQGFHSPAP